ncbi:MAG: hypothetical protein II604_08460 [Bacteroidales bacterium]|nr:hypothetical protein [Bacteroidales bacterium]
MKLIDKDALVAEIDRKINILEKNRGYTGVFGDAQLDAYDNMKTFVDTLEVKEVDLEKEIKEEYLKRRCYGGKDNMIVILSEPKFNTIAKHFFELGLKAQKKE